MLSLDRYFAHFFTKFRSKTVFGILSILSKDKSSISLVPPSISTTIITFHQSKQKLITLVPMDTKVLCVRIATRISQIYRHRFFTKHFVVTNLLHRVHLLFSEKNAIHSLKYKPKKWDFI